MKGQQSSNIVIPEHVTAVRLYADHVDLSRISFLKPSAVESVTVFAMTLEVSQGSVLIPGKKALLVADRFVSKKATIESDIVRGHIGFAQPKDFLINLRECDGDVDLALAHLVVPSRPRVHFTRGLGREDTIYRKHIGWKEGEKFVVHPDGHPMSGEVGVFRGLNSQGVITWREALVTPGVYREALKQVADLAVPSVLAAANLLRVTRDEQERRRLLAFLHWLRADIPAGTNDPQLVAVDRLVSATVAGIQLAPKANYVPYLGRAVFEKQMDNLLVVLAKLETEVAQIEGTKTIDDALQVLNRNNGAGLVSFAKAVAAKEGDLAAHHRALVADRARQLEQIVERGEACKKKIDEWKSTLEQRVKAFEKAYKKEQYIKLAKGIAELVGTAVLTAATFIPSGGASTLMMGAGLIQITQMTVNAAGWAEKIAKVIELLIKIWEVVALLLGGLTTDLDPKTSVEKVNLPEEALWQEALNEFRGALPKDAAESQRDALVAAYENMVLWFQAAAKLAVEGVEIQADKALNESLAKISADQHERLDGLNPDQQSLPAVDWTRLFADLAVMEQAMTSRLLDVYTNLERAFRYEFATEPAPLRPEDLDLYHLRRRVDELWNKLHDAWSKGKKPGVHENLRIEFKGIDAALFRDDGYVDCDVTIKSHLAKVFNNMAMIRVQSVRVEVSARSSAKSKGNDLRVSTDSGQYLVDWKVDGEAFVDVTPKNQLVELSTAPLSGSSRYKCEGNERLQETVAKWWDENTLHITPFTRWRIGIPSGLYAETNGGLRLEVEEPGGVFSRPKRVPATKVDVALVFTVQALTVPRAARAQSAKGAAAKKVAAKEAAAKEAPAKKAATKKAPPKKAAPKRAAAKKAATKKVGR